jgi:hypothetical protein
MGEKTLGQICFEAWGDDGCTWEDAHQSTCDHFEQAAQAVRQAVVTELQEDISIIKAHSAAVERERWANKVEALADMQEGAGGDEIADAFRGLAKRMRAGGKP